MIQVDPEFKALIPALSTEERAGLEADIVRDGRATVPIVLWGEVLLDGHNRFEICGKHGLPYTTTKAPEWIQTRNDAEIWILQTALNRRNVGPITRASIVQQLEPRLRARNEAIRLATLKQNQTKVESLPPAGREGAKFTCPDCGDIFSDVVWHCRKCAHHWPVYVKKCKNCLSLGEATKRPAAHSTDPKKVGDRHARETVVQAAAQAGMSHPTYTAAKVVIERGTPELKAAADRGDVAVSTAAQLAQLPPEKQREVVAQGPKAAQAAAKEIRADKLEAKRQERVDKIAEISKGDAPLTGALGKFPVIYADPPWRYEHVETESRAIENQYPTMSLDDICAMKVGDIATPDAWLFMWATSPKLAEAMRVLQAWGFEYRTCAVWVKSSGERCNWCGEFRKGQIGMGYVYRQRHELLLVAKRGTPPTPSPADRPDSVINAPDGEHSSKPDLARQQIEQMFPKWKRVELFCRKPAPGWAVWGNQS